MEIILKNNLDLYVLLIFLVLLILKSSKAKEIELDRYLYKDTTNNLKGLAVIIVVFHHISLYLTEGSIFTFIFRNAGFLAVSIFLFMSGYGLTVQKIKKENYLKGFIFNKIIKLYLIFFISNITVTIINNLFLQTSYNIKDIISSSMRMNFSNGRELWFVAIILFCYLSFYICFKFFDYKKGLILICLTPLMYICICKILGKGTWWYNTAFCFAIGVLVATYKEKIFNIFKNRTGIYISLSIIIFMISMYFYIKGIATLQYIIPFIFIIIICSILIKFELNSKFLNFINKISFEMYLVHLIVLKVTFKDATEKGNLYLIILFPIMIFLAYIVKLISDRIFNILKSVIRLD